MGNGLSVVISAYKRRGIENSLVLAKSIEPHVDEIFVVVNDDEAADIRLQELSGIEYIFQRNLGMNIGAWSTGLSLCDERNVVLCLQDECTIVDPHFADHYRNLLCQPDTGMVGESLNPKWDHPWSSLKKSPVNYSLKTAGAAEISRVDFYLRCMEAWGISPGNTGAHLRALVWGFSPTVRRKLKQLPLGTNKEQCIAAEIGVCKYVENNLFLKVSQSAARPFSYIAHGEWDSSGWAKKQ